MVARDVVVFLVGIIHTGPFQSGFDSQHRQFVYWIENAGGSIPSCLSLNFFGVFGRFFGAMVEGDRLVRGLSSIFVTFGEFDIWGGVTTKAACSLCSSLLCSRIIVQTLGYLFILLNAFSRIQPKSPSPP